MRLGYSRLFILSGLLCLSTVYANNSAIGSFRPLNKVKLVATLNGQPALREAEWKIYNIHDPRHIVATLPRHSGTVFLPAGDFITTVKVGNYMLQTRKFRVEADADNLVKVAVR